MFLYGCSAFHITPEEDLPEIGRPSPFLTWDRNTVRIQQVKQTLTPDIQRFQDLELCFTPMIKTGTNFRLVENAETKKKCFTQTKTETYMRIEDQHIFILTFDVRFLDTQYDYFQADICHYKCQYITESEILDLKNGHPQR